VENFPAFDFGNTVLSEIAAPEQDMREDAKAYAVDPEALRFEDQLLTICVLESVVSAVVTDPQIRTEVLEGLLHRLKQMQNWSRIEAALLDRRPIYIQAVNDKVPDEIVWSVSEAFGKFVTGRFDPLVGPYGSSRYVFLVQQMKKMLAETKLVAG